jgi:hypothetical protein
MVLSEPEGCCETYKRGLGGPFQVPLNNHRVALRNSDMLSTLLQKICSKTTMKYPNSLIFQGAGPAKRTVY